MSEQIQKIKKLVKTGFFHIFGSSVINKCLGFLSSTILVWLLTKEEYGRFTYAWNIYSIAIVLNGLGADSAIIQLCSEHSENELYVKKICNFGVCYGVIFSMIMGLVLLFVSILVPMKIQDADKMLRLMFALPLVQLIYNLFSVYLRAKKRNQDYAKLSMINTVFHVIFSVGGAVLFRENGLVISYYISYGLSILVCMFYMKVKLLSLHGQFPEKKERKAMLSISLVSACNNGLSQIMYLLDIFVLGIVAAQETVLASYRVATIIPSALSFIPSSLVIYIYPYFAEHRQNRRWCLQAYSKIVIWFGLFNFAVFLLLFSFAPYVIRIIYGNQYLDAVSIFRLLSLNYFFSATFRTVAGNLLVAQRKLNFNLIVGITASALNVITDFFFVQWWGSMGAALATVFVTVFSGALYTSHLIKVYISDK